MKSNKLIIFTLAVITIVALIVRLKGITQPVPFWVDEFSAAKNAHYLRDFGISAFTHPTLQLEKHNITTHALIALSFMLFGNHEWAARLPMALLGSLIPLSVYFLARIVYDDKKTGIVAALLSTFSYMLIVWSRQAREFSFLPLLINIHLALFLTMISKKSAQQIRLFVWLSFAIITVLGVMTHPFFYIVIIIEAIYGVLMGPKQVRSFFAADTRRIVAAVFAFCFILAWMYFQDVFHFFAGTLFGANNLWYYHSFLWRVYGTLTLMGLVGFVIGMMKGRSSSALLLLYFIAHLFFVTFIFSHYISKYLMPIMPLLYIGMAYTITSLFTYTQQAPSILRRHKLLSTSAPTILAIGLTLFIILNGDKYVNKPQSYYSPNNDFREIAVVDYDQIYDIVKKKYQQTTDIAIIETWPDRAKWYLGYDITKIYLLRWADEQGEAGGHVKKTTHTIDSKGQKITVGKEKFILISSAYDLQLAMKMHAHGFLIIDDASMPADVIQYANTHLKKELYLEHFVLEDNPTSNWPITLYSWGFGK